MDKKLVLVTGGTSGIGLGLVEYLLDTGEYKVIAISRKKENINNAKKYLDKKAKDVHFISADASIEKDCIKVLSEIETEYGYLDGLVNSAGVIKMGGIEDSSLEDWNYSIQNNLTSSYTITKVLLPLLKKGNSPSIVNVSSISSIATGTSLAYCTSKAGLDMLTKCLARELGKYNIRVNSVNPGVVRSNLELSNGVFQTQDEYQHFLESARVAYPLGRIGEPVDITPAIEFLLSEKSSWTTGTTMVIDGGRLVYN